jgi:hypothetical protein
VQGDKKPKPGRASVGEENCRFFSLGIDKEFNCQYKFLENTNILIYLFDFPRLF